MERFSCIIHVSIRRRQESNRTCHKGSSEHNDAIAGFEDNRGSRAKKFTRSREDRKGKKMVLELPQRNATLRTP